MIHYYLNEILFIQMKILINIEENNFHMVIIFIDTHVLHKMRRSRKNMGGLQSF